jgi:HK97 family phage major capsid protein
MGKIAELLEKKALGTLTDDEKKELDTLLKEASVAKAVGEDESKPVQPSTPNEEDAAVDALAQKLADAASTKLDSSVEKIQRVIDSMEEKVNVKVTHEAVAPFLVDKQLGKKHSVQELSEIKYALPERKKAGKQVTEISQKTVEFLSAFFQGDKQKLQILSEGTAADGGYLVPEEFANMIVEDIRDVSIMRQLASVMSTNTDTVHIPSLISRPKAAWRAEKAAKQTSTASFSENVLTPYSLASIVPLTNEFVADASLGVGGSVVSYISGLLGTSLAEEEEKAFWTGNGSGKPTGVDGGSYSLRTVAAGAGASDSQRADAIVSAVANTPQGYRNRGVWVGNMGTWAEVARLKDSQNRYFLSDLAGSATQLLRGRPLYESNFLAGGTLLYGDFSYYQIVDREGLSIRVSDEATVGGSSAFEKNLTFIRAEKRVDGELLLPAAITKVTGVGTP